MLESGIGLEFQCALATLDVCQRRCVSGRRCVIHYMALSCATAASHGSQLAYCIMFERLTFVLCSPADGGYPHDINPDPSGGWSTKNLCAGDRCVRLCCADVCTSVRRSCGLHSKLMNIMSAVAGLPLRCCVSSLATASSSMRQTPRTALHRTR